MLVSFLCLPTPAAAAFLIGQITKKYDKKVVGLQEVDGVVLEPLEPLTEKMLELAHQKVRSLSRRLIHAADMLL